MRDELATNKWTETDPRAPFVSRQARPTGAGATD
jgi:hypothetical protein